MTPKIEKSLTAKSNVLLEIQLDPELLSLIASIEKDVSKVVSDALILWLKERWLICPITGDFCVNLQGSCNTCSIFNK